MRKIQAALLVLVLACCTVTPSFAAKKVTPKTPAKTAPKAPAKAPSKPQPAAPIAAKLGDACSTNRAEGKDGDQALVCTTLGNKMSWQPSVAAIQLAIWSDLQKLQAANPDVTTSLEIHQSPNANKDIAKAIIGGVNSAAKLWQRQYLPEKPLPTLLYSEKDRQWFIDRMNSLNVYSTKQLSNFDNEVSRNGNRANGAGITGDGGRLWMTFMIGTAKTKQDNMDSQIPAHEYTHLAQHAIAPDPKNALTCWQVEGGGFFYGIFLGAKSADQVKTYTQQRNTDPGFANFPGLVQSRDANWEKYLDQFGPNYQNTPCGPNGAYAVGSVANEYLYSLKGHDGIISMFQKTSETGDFTVAVEQVYGKPWPTLRKEIADYIQLVIAQN